MKTKSFLTVGAALFAAAFLRADDAASRVDVQFDHPDKFTDLKDRYTPTEKGQEGLMAMFKDYLQERAPKRLPDGQKLSVTFTDIDMAGDFEPWRGPAGMDVRIVKDIYIPRLKFSYKVTDASGAVVKEGNKELSDMNFQMSLAGAIDSQDPLRYEKRMLDDWMRSELQPPKAKKK